MIGRGGGVGGGGSGGGEAHRISQSLYDESVLENQDAFDLSPDGAASETAEQFARQGVDLSHLATSHPRTEGGRRDRSDRDRFEGWLDGLDERVGADGTVRVGGEDDAEFIREALGGIAAMCSGRAAVDVDDDAGADADGDADADADGGDGDGAGGGGSGDSDAGGYGDEDDDDDDDDTEAGGTAGGGSNVPPKKGGGGGGVGVGVGGLPYLTLLLQSNSMYTLMSLLGAATVPPSGGPSDAGEDNHEEREEVLRCACRCLTSVLSPATAPSTVAAEAAAAVNGAKRSLRDSFVAFDRLAGLMMLYSARRRDADGVGREESTETLTELARLASAACGGCEINKVAFVRAGRAGAGGGGSGSGSRRGGGVSAVMGALTPPLPSPPSNSDLTLLTELCRLIGVLCRFDDFRSPADTGGGGHGTAVSSAHDHALEFHRAGAVPVLRGIAEAALDRVADGGGGGAGGGGGRAAAEAEAAALASSALSAARALAVNDEIVRGLVAAGILGAVGRALEMGAAASVGDGGRGDGAGGRIRARGGRSLTASALGLMRNLCGNDDVKTALCAGSSDPPRPSSLPSILGAMRTYRYHRPVQEHGCGTLAAMALRRPGNARRIVEMGGPGDVLTAMRRHPDCATVQRQGALAVRNIVSRLVTGGGDGDGAEGGVAAAGGDGDGVRDAFLDLGAEDVLRSTAGRHRGSVDEAYAALRDLGCEASLVRIDADSDDAVVRTRTAMFGDERPRFNPVFEESDELAGRGGMGGRIAGHASGMIG